MATIGNVTIRIGATAKQLEYDLKKAEKSLQATSMRLKTIGQNLTLGLTLPLGLAGAGAFKLASDMEESLNKVRVAFGNSSASVEAFTEDTLTMYGIAKGSALDMAAFFGDMATSMGLPQDAAAQMSKSLVGLAGDVASFKNVPLAEVQTALGGIFTGETESLKRLGVAMQEENVKAFALAQGITKLYKDMTLAEKTTLRYQYVMDALRNSTGDFERTQDGAANQMRIFQESVKELGASFGSVLLPVITPIINAANNMLKSFRELSPETKKFIVIGAALAAALGPVLIILGQTVTAVGALQIAFVKMGSGLLSASKLFLALNPTVLIAVGALTALAAVGIAVYNSLNKVSSTQKAVSDINKQVTSDITRQKVQTEQLIGVVNNSNASLDDRKKALLQLQSIAPSYFNNLDIEKSSINDINAAYQTYIKALKDSARQKAIENKLVDLETEKLEIQERLTDAQRKYNAAQKSAISGSAFEKSALEGVKKEYAEIEKTISTIASQSKPLNVSSTSETTSVINTNFKPAAKEAQTLQQEISGIKDRIEALSISYQKKPSDGILNELNRQIDLLKSKETTLANAETLVERLSGGDVKPIELLPSTQSFDSSLKTISTYVTGKLAGLGKTISQSLKPTVTNSQFSEFSKGLSSELLNIERQFDNGILSGLEADSQRIQLLTSSLANLRRNGFGELSSEVQFVKGQIANVGGENFTKISDTVGKINSNLAIAGQAVQAVGGLFDSFSQAQIDKINAKEQAEKDAINKSTLDEETKQKRITEAEKRYSKERAAVQRRIAIANKAQAIFGATVAMFQGLAQTLTLGPAGVALLPLIKGLGLLNIAAIAATPLPSLAIGTDYVRSDGMAMLHRGEAVVPADVVGGGFSRGGSMELHSIIRGNDIHLINEQNKARAYRMK